MSIHDLYHKIKGKTGLDNMTIMYLFVLVGVGISAFGLGRLSVPTSAQYTDGIGITQTASSNPYTKQQSQIFASKSKESQNYSQSGIQRNFVASKNGKLYYPSSCKGANRIKEENRVWFDTKEDAEKSGYAWATSCK